MDDIGERALSRRGHAVVIGAGMAGLLASRVLSDHFDRVTIVERDRLPDEPATRPGVPQSRHIHVLLIRGQRELERLFPSLDDELRAAGAPLLDWLADFRWVNFAGPKPRFPSDLKARSSSRQLLEWLVRRQVASCPRVQFAEACEAIGLLLDRDRRGVAGVRTRVRGGAEGGDGDRELPADLVVDASGTSSRAPQWLEALGYPVPQETRIDAFGGYASRLYRPPSDFEPDWRALYLQPTPPSVKRGGVLYPVEGKRWMVTLVGVGRDYPPTDNSGFQEFARSLPDPSLYEAIQGAEPLSPIYGFQQMANRRRHYERLPSMPERFVVLGDAACAFNPVYAQGMTVAALSVLALDHVLRKRPAGRDLSGLSRDFQQKLARVNAVPWLLSTGEDLRVPEAEGGHPGPMVQLLQRYVDGVMVLGAREPRAHLAVGEVLSMMKPPIALFHPWIAGRMLAQLIQDRLAGSE